MDGGQIGPGGQQLNRISKVGGGRGMMMPEMLMPEEAQMSQGPAPGALDISSHPCIAAAPARQYLYSGVRLGTVRAPQGQVASISE